MITLGIESTAHTFGIGIMKNNKFLANEKTSYKPPLGEGIHPREAAEHHSEVCDKILKKALNKARIKIQDIDLIAFAQGPGIGPCLRVGGVVARTLSLYYKKPLIGVNHCIAHIEISKLINKAKEPVMLYVSGGNTQIIALEGNRYRVFGETLDIPVGNLLDVWARVAGLPMPGGVEVDKLHKKGRNYLPLPYSVKGMDVSFSGIYTNAKDMIGKHALEDIAYSIEETAFAMLVEVTERAMAHCQKKELILSGGVASSKRLQKMCEIMCRERGAKLFLTPREFAGDNGAMIAYLGQKMYSAGHRLKIKDSEVIQKMRTDDLEITW